MRPWHCYMACNLSEYPLTTGWKMRKVWAWGRAGVVLMGLSGFTWADSVEPGIWRQQALDQVRAAMRPGAVELDLPQNQEQATAATWQLSAKLYSGGEVRAFQAAAGGSLQQA